MKHLRLSLIVAATLAACDNAPTMPDAIDDTPDPTVYTADCDPILEKHPGTPCAMPWPSSLYLLPSQSTRTGFALQFGATSLPANNQGKNISPTGYAKLDGYGPSTPIIVHFPSLDVSTLATEDHIERSLAEDAAIILLEDDKGQQRRVPYLVEMDRSDADPSLQSLYVRPAEILKEATRYVVAFRNLRDTHGVAFKPTRAFTRLVDGKTDSEPLLKQRQERFNKTFATLNAKGIASRDLVLAWEFVTASNDALHGDLLRMRDDALQRVGAMGPTLSVDKIIEFAPTMDGSGKPVDANIAVEVQGSFTVPSYLAPWQLDDFNGSKLNRDGMGRVAANGTRAPRFWVRIPYSAVDGKATPHGLVMYGHGLLGEGSQVTGSFNSRIANGNNLIFFAANLTGMASEDQSNVLNTMGEISRFPSMADRLQQGLVEWVLLMRAMRERLDTLPELLKYNIKVNRAETFYSGISQGGIFGASFMALTPDVQRGHLGVPGNNYSLLLQRSKDFDPFSIVFNSAYMSTRDQALSLSLMQLLWDATDPVTHLRHIVKDPYPGNAPHQVLMGPARGDYQVAVLSNEILARSDLGIGVMKHYDDDRSIFGVTEQAYPKVGSGIVLWHFGNPWPAIGNRAPMDPPGDPHGKPRKVDAHNDQMVHFFRTGEIIDACADMTCWPEGHP